MVNEWRRRIGAGAHRRVQTTSFQSFSGSPVRRRAPAPTLRRVLARGQATVEFVLMLSFLTAIGILIMTLLTGQGNNAIGVGESKAVNVIAND